MMFWVALSRGFLAQYSRGQRPQRLRPLQLLPSRIVKPGGERPVPVQTNIASLRHLRNSGERSEMNCVALYELGDSYLRNFTPEQLACSYPCRTWFDRGIIAVGSSDVPVVDCDVLVNLRSAVTRLTASGKRMGPNQGVTIDEALRMFTINGAFASFEENLKGTITPANSLTWSSSPPTHAPSAEDLPSLSIDMTVIDGQVAYER